LTGYVPDLIYPNNFQARGGVVLLPLFPTVGDTTPMLKTYRIDGEFNSPSSLSFLATLHLMQKQTIKIQQCILCK